MSYLIEIPRAVEGHAISASHREAGVVDAKGRYDSYRYDSHELIPRETADPRAQWAS